MQELLSFSILELGKRLKNRSLSSEEVTKAYLERIKETDEKIHAYLSILEDDAINAAQIADKGFKKITSLHPCKEFQSQLKIYYV